MWNRKFDQLRHKFKVMPVPGCVLIIIILCTHFSVWTLSSFPVCFCSFVFYLNFFPTFSSFSWWTWIQDGKLQGGIAHIFDYGRTWSIADICGIGAWWAPVPIINSGYPTTLKENLLPNLFFSQNPARCGDSWRLPKYLQHRPIF